jgi:transposase
MYVREILMNLENLHLKLTHSLLISYYPSCRIGRKEKWSVKGLQQWAAVQELHRKRVSIRRIARDLGISRNTVRRLLKLKEEPRYSRKQYPSKLEGFLEQMLEWRCAPFEFNGKRIYKELQKSGYTGSIRPVYRSLKRIDEDVGHISSKATVRIETPVGDQAQFDWAEYEMEVGGGIHKIYCFSMISAACRKKGHLFFIEIGCRSHLRSHAGTV